MITQTYLKKNHVKMLLRKVYLFIPQSSLHCIALYVLAPTIKTTEL